MALGDAVKAIAIRLKIELGIFQPAFKRVIFQGTAAAFQSVAGQ